MQNLRKNFFFFFLQTEFPFILEYLPLHFFRHVMVLQNIGDNSSPLSFLIDLWLPFLGKIYRGWFLAFYSGELRVILNRLEYQNNLTILL